MDSDPVGSKTTSNGSKTTNDSGKTDENDGAVGNKNIDDQALQDNYDEIFQFLDEFYGKLKKPATKKPKVRFKVSFTVYFTLHTLFLFNIKKISRSAFLICKVAAFLLVIHTCCSLCDFFCTCCFNNLISSCKPQVENVPEL